jgi:hypothetical protein
MVTDIDSRNGIRKSLQQAHFEVNTIIPEAESEVAHPSHENLLNPG